MASGTDPLLLITRRVPGRSLFDVAHGLDPDRAGRGLAEFLAALHHLRALPGTGAGLLGATVRHYATMTGRQVAVDRVLAWHVRTMLGDALWRRSPVGELLARFRQLGVDLRIATP